MSESSSEPRTDGSASAPVDPSSRSAGVHGPGKVIAVLIGVPVLVAIVLTLFAWPAANTAPRNLPLGLVAPPPVAGQITDGLARAGAALGGDEDAFDVHSYESAERAEEAIEDREIYGAIVINADGVTVMTASAASPVVAQLLGGLASNLEAQLPELPAPPGSEPGEGEGPAVSVVDVVPATAEDPRGAVLASSVLPLVLAGLATGALLFMLFRPGLGQALVLVVAAAAAGSVVVAITQGWLGAFGGDWWLNAAALALMIAAIAGGIVGLGTLLGRVGLGLGAAVMMLLGNPFSGLASAPEMLPTWAGTLGQWLPPGAGGQLLRSTAFFDGAAAGGPLLVLSLWAGLGLLAIIAVGLVRRSDRTVAAG